MIGINGDFTPSGYFWGHRNWLYFVALHTWACLNYSSACWIHACTWNMYYRYNVRHLQLPNCRMVVLCENTHYYVGQLNWIPGNIWEYLNIWPLLLVFLVLPRIGPTYRGTRCTDVLPPLRNCAGLRSCYSVVATTSSHLAWLTGGYLSCIDAIYDPHNTGNRYFRSRPPCSIVGLNFRDVDVWKRLIWVVNDSEGRLVKSFVSYLRYVILWDKRFVGQAFRPPDGPMRVSDSTRPDSMRQTVEVRSTNENFIELELYFGLWHLWSVHSTIDAHRRTVCRTVRR